MEVEQFRDCWWSKVVGDAFGVDLHMPVETMKRDTGVVLFQTLGVTNEVRFGKE
jgi:hypothetical protein